MTAYIVSNVDVFDRDKYGHYQELAVPTIKKYGGEILSRGGAAEILEGHLPANRIVLIKFKDMDAARAFYNSPEYTEARGRREGASDFNMMVFDGVENDVEPGAGN